MPASRYSRYLGKCRSEPYPTTRSPRRGASVATDPFPSSTTLSGTVMFWTFISLGAGQDIDTAAGEVYYSLQGGNQSLFDHVLVKAKELVEWNPVVNGCLHDGLTSTVSTRKLFSILPVPFEEPTGLTMRRCLAFLERGEVQATAWTASLHLAAIIAIIKLGKKIWKGRITGPSGPLGGEYDFGLNQPRAQLVRHRGRNGRFLRGPPTIRMQGSGTRTTNGGGPAETSPAITGKAK